MTHNYREKKLIENGWKVIGGISEVPNHGLCIFIQSPGSISSAKTAWMCYESGHIYWHDGSEGTWDQLVLNNFSPPKGN